VRGECSRGEGSEMRGGGGWLRHGRSPQEAEARGRGVGNVGAAFGSGGSILAKGEGGGSCSRWGKELTGGPALSAKEGEGREEVGWRLAWLGRLNRRRRGRHGPRGGQAEMRERERGEGIGFSF